MTEPAQDFTQETTYAATRRPVAEATTLLPAAYTSERFFALERERVFASGWVAVGATSEVAAPGDLVVADVAGRSVVVVRGRDGELRAFYNVCRHRGARLLDPGTTHVRRSIRCPYHSWAYDLEGRCMGTPLFEGSPIPDDGRAVFATHGAGLDRSRLGLLPAAVATFGCVVLVNLDAEPEPLEEGLGDLPARLAGYRLEEWEVARTADYDVAANFKLVAENFMEYYHLPWVHPGLVKVSPMEAHHRWQGAGRYTGMCTSPIAADTEEGGWGGGLAPMPGLGDEDGVAGRFVWLFPNLALNVLPNHVFLIVATPRGPRATTERTYLLTHPLSAGEGAEEAVDAVARFWDAVNREDIEIVERVQEGLDTTPFAGGPLSYRFEEPVHRFQNMVIDRMVGRRRVPPGDAEPATPMFA